jgi:transcription-repair coupling factor (superfamily II helicase)
VHAARGSGGHLPLLLITETNQRAAQMQQFMTVVERLVNDREPDVDEFLNFPDLEPQNLFEYFDPPLEVVDLRNRVLDGLRKGRTRLVVTSYKACWRLLPELAEQAQQQLQLGCSSQKHPSPNHAGEVTRKISREELAAQLVALGYSGAGTVQVAGQFALRGGLVDVFPVGAELPVRIDLFGSEIESINVFDPGTQRSLERQDTVRILPVSAHSGQLRDPGVLAWLRERWDSYAREYSGASGRSSFERLEEVVSLDLAALAAGNECSRAGWYYHATLSEHTTLWNYLPKGSRVLVHEDGFVESESNSYFRFWEARHDDWLKNALGFLKLSDSYLLPAKGLQDVMRDLRQGRLHTRLLNDDGQAICLSLDPVYPLLTSSFDGPLAAENPVRSSSVGLQTPAPGKWSTSRLPETLRGYSAISPPLQRSEVSVASGANKINLPMTVLSQFSARLREVLTDEQLWPEVENAILPGGFILPDDEWSLITDVEIFGEIAEVEVAQPKRYRTHALRRPDDLAPGDYVVHIDYGIGRFAQLVDRETGGLQKTYAAVEYANKDRLFVPVEQLDRLRRYSFDGSEPQLNNLGKDTWKKTKEKVKKDTLELARKLLSLYKSRQQRMGHAYGQGTVWEQEFAEGFPYELTEDQARAWQEVQADMEAAKPMDRLLVGDVGFGKTEVAMRAAFKACVDERQVLILCPTTVLADQHFTTFTRRFRAFPFRVGILSRFQSPAEQRQTIEHLRLGRLDVLIATHRGLSKDVRFRNIGLLVIDEEQRFGVKQKEQLRMQFPGVDVLAMSATPIPRTLHMSLVGVRDISVIETAPTARKAIKTYVGEHDEMLVREAMLRELGRGGQIYFLHNRVQDIESVRIRLEELLPGEKVIVAHGQMADDKLEEVMHAFSLGAYRIMLATTIIENGLDIPSVNTIIVDKAEHLGLAQMHQLRGRVGRSSQQAYAYFFHSSSRLLSEDSQRRLHAIYNYAYLGAGYEIAQSDLRIRGAGNLLGEEQSGLAKSVGFEYYCELLAKSINEVRERSTGEIEAWDEEDGILLVDTPSAQIDLPLSCYIPEGYIADPVLRLEILRNIAALDNPAAVEAYVEEIKDRFGTVPPEVLNMLTAVNLRNLATTVGLEQLAYNRLRESFVLRFRGGLPDFARSVQLLDGRFIVAATGELLLQQAFHDESDAPALVDALDFLLEQKT